MEKNFKKNSDPLVRRGMSTFAYNISIILYMRVLRWRLKRLFIRKARKQFRFTVVADRISLYP